MAKAFRTTSFLRVNNPIIRSGKYGNDPAHVGYSILIYTIRNRPKKVREAFKKHAEYLTIFAVSLGELICGAEKSAQSARNLADVEVPAA